MFRKNKTYNVYIKPDMEISLDNIVFVQKTFSLMVMILNIFWVLYLRIWKLAALMFVVLSGFGLLFYFDIIDYIMLEVLRIGFLIWVGFEIADWREEKLQDDGYIFYDIVCAYSQDEAAQRFLDKNLPQLLNEPSQHAEIIKS